MTQVEHSFVVSEPATGNVPQASAEWLTMVAEDLGLLGRLHGAEIEAETFEALKAAGFPDCLVLPASTDEGVTARDLLKRVVDGEDAELRSSFDDLAVDYAAIYLTVRYQASPNESAWLDEDGLERQAPMFAVREWYKRYDLGAGDWRVRQDDNLSLQLQFLAHLFMSGKDHLQAAATFLDEHPLLWIERFAERVGGRAATPFYAGLAMLTADYLRTLRSALIVVADAPLPPPVVEKKWIPVAEAVSCGADVTPFMPGMGPSW